MPIILRILIILVSLLISACGKQPWNNPYPAKQTMSNIRYTSFTAPPKTLDPARSYSSDEVIFTAQIYEPPLQYHYLIRPYTLVPLTTTKMPKITYLDKEGKLLPNDTPDEKVAYTVYDIEIKPGIYYQPHPAFAKNDHGEYYYLYRSPKEFRHISTLSDFKHTGTRELVADDYVYEIKRLGKPGVNSPIFGLMATKIVGLEEFATYLAKQTSGNTFIDLRKYKLSGAYAIDRYRYRIIIKNKYQQFLYWLAMPFFAPIPWEADLFYSKPELNEKNINFDWYPIGTGPYMMTENNPNRRMVLQKNPYFHTEYYPSVGSTNDAALGLLKDAGKKLPFIDKVVFSLEKEVIPRWNKFLQGYYDLSAVSSDSFDQAIQIDKKGNPYLTPNMQKMGLHLETSITPAISYIGFNMLDDVVGGYSERARKLRLAISIAIDYEEYINIFLNGRGAAAQGPIPPGIFGYLTGEKGINPYVYVWKNNEPVRKPISVARKLLKEAGYPNGIDPKTNEPLILNYDVATSGGPDEKAMLNWMREQFAKLGIQLNIRATEYNRFQEIVRVGQSQIFNWGWIADYPDPENFLFLLYGGNSKLRYGGENATNYQNSNFDKLFDQMKNMPNNEARLRIINSMLAIVRRDAPWVWGVISKDFVLSHQWNSPSKPSDIINNILKYQSIQPKLRASLQVVWNKRVIWPLIIIVILFILISLPVFIRHWQRERKSIK